MATLAVVSQPDPAAGYGPVRLVSHVPGSPLTTASGASEGGVVSADGRFVVFTSAATNLVPGQSGPADLNVFLYERATGAVTLVSHAAASTTTPGAAQSHFPSISADGSFVAFESWAPDLVAGQVEAAFESDIFLYERATGMIRLVSHTTAGPTTAAGARSQRSKISADGAFVVFDSRATNLVPGQVDNNSVEDVFLFERATDALTLASHSAASPTTTGNRDSLDPDVSAGGSVAFSSRATDLVAGQTDTNNDYDVFLFSPGTGAVTLVSHSPASSATTGDSYSRNPAISADGGWVAFEATASNLVAGQIDTNTVLDVFLFSRASGLVSLVSHVAGSSVTAPPWAYYSVSPMISADGGFVAFDSAAGNLVAGMEDFGGADDVFLYERVTDTTHLVSRAADTSEGVYPANRSSTRRSLSPDGRFVLFISGATNLVPASLNRHAYVNVYLYDHSLAKQAGGSPVTLVSYRAAATSRWSTLATGGSMSADASFISFNSDAADVVVGQDDINTERMDVFLYQRADVPLPPPADFGGDRRTDIAVYRPPNGIWLVQGGPTVAWGTAGDIPVPGDYDGDAIADIAVFRPSIGAWFIRESGGGQRFVVWGTSASIPVPGDYDGDEKTDVGVFDPATAQWEVQLSTGGTFSAPWGIAGDIPVPADYDGNGRIDAATFRPSNGAWNIRIKGGGDFISGGDLLYVYGTTGDIPVPGDYDGDAKADIAVFRPSNGLWFVLGTGGTETIIAWGTNGDIPVPGDYDGDCDTEHAVFRPSLGIWFVRGGATSVWGTHGDVPLAFPDAIRRFYFAPL